MLDILLYKRYNTLLSLNKHNIYWEISQLGKNGVFMKKVIVCDHDEKTVSKLGKMIEELFPRQFQIDGYVSARQLVYEMEDGFLRSADLLFVDMEMKEMDGIEIAKLLQKKMPVLKIIFMTGFPKRAEEIFDEISPFGLLLKPFCKERLAKYMKRELEGVNRKSRFVEIKKKGRNYHLPMEEVYYVESSARKLLIHKKEETECVYERISNFCVLYEDDFVRCHQSYAVNWGQVAEVSAAGIILKNGVKVPISRQKYREVRSKIF